MIVKKVIVVVQKGEDDTDTRRLHLLLGSKDVYVRSGDWSVTGGKENVRFIARNSIGEFVYKGELKKITDQGFLECRAQGIPEHRPADFAFLSFRPASLQPGDGGRLWIRHKVDGFDRGFWQVER